MTLTGNQHHQTHILGLIPSLIYLSISYWCFLGSLLKPFACKPQMESQWGHLGGTLFSSSAAGLLDLLQCWSRSLSLLGRLWPMIRLGGEPGLIILPNSWLLHCIFCVLLSHGAVWDSWELHHSFRVFFYNLPPFPFLISYIRSVLLSEGFLCLLLPPFSFLVLTEEWFKWISCILNSVLAFVSPRTNLITRAKSCPKRQNLLRLT